MSGIAGIYHFDGPSVAPGALPRMTDAMAHRGPDGARHWRDGAVGLGHRMLRVAPGAQQATLRAGEAERLVVTADARLDNRSELIGRLRGSGGVNGKPGREISDSELILAAYRKWGTACPDELLGAFAFAVWDARERRLFCARDHFGVKPFYYYYAPGELFAFASEIKALFALDAVPQTLDERRIAQYVLMPVEESAADTFYEEVRALKPAHTGIVGPDAFSERRYWALDPEREVRLGSNEEYAEALRDLFREAVRCRMRSNAPLSTMLSGGLDSSSVACTAAELSGPEDRPIHTLSAIFNEVPASDEQPFIRAVLDKYDRLTPLFFEADQVSPLDEFDERSWHAGAPVGLNSYIPWNLYRAARERGARVVLSGFDGDTTVSHGHTYLHELARQGRWLALMLEVRGGRKRQDMPWLRAMRTWLRTYALKPKLENSRLLRLLRQVWRTLRGRSTETVESDDSRDDWQIGLNEAFITRVEDHLASTTTDRPRTERAHHHHLLTRALMPRMLESLDAAAAAAGVEVRFPFFDKRLIEFCLALPPEQKIHRGWTRMVMRHAMEGILPEKVQWRPNKSNLGPSNDHGLLKFEQEQLEETFRQNTGGVGEYVDLDALHEVCREYAREQKRGPKVLLLKYALSLALWLQRPDISQPRSQPTHQEVMPGQ